MRHLAILGASGHGKVVADTALQAGWDTVTYFDDAWPELQNNGDRPVAGDTDELFSSAEQFDGFAIAIGNNRTRRALAKRLIEADLPLPPLRHPNAYVAKDVEIEPGVVLFAGSVVQPGCKLGLATIINTGASVDHDCSLAAGVHICPGANLAGGIRIGECSWIGIGSSINQGLIIGSDATVGTGAAVVLDVANNETVVGVPAKVMMRK